MLIREERPDEFPRIYSLVEAAFKTARVADGDEQEYVDRLRASDRYIPELALVAVGADDELIGHVMLTVLPYVSDDGRAVRTLLLAPLSVLLEYRSKGVGAALAREAMRRAGVMYYQTVFLAGDPGYYGRFGFRRSDSFGVRCDSAIPPQFLLAAELTSGCLGAGVVDMTVI